MFCCLMGLNLEDWRWPVEMGGPKVGITHDGRPPERRGGHHVAMGAIMMCHGHLEGEGHWGEEGVLCYFQVQLLLKCNFVTPTGQQADQPSCRYTRNSSQRL